jgi:quercetin dioxygenase-like cupin family protein
MPIKEIEMKRTQIVAAGAAGVMLLGVLAATAQDAVKTQPDMNKVLFENDRVRVIEVTTPPGKGIDMHSHPDHLVYMLDDNKTRMTGKDGKAMDVEGKKGGVRWVDATSHKVENVGTTPLHAIVVELKEAAK